MRIKIWLLGALLLWTALGLAPATYALPSLVATPTHQHSYRRKSDVAISPDRVRHGIRNAGLSSLLPDHGNDPGILPGIDRGERFEVLAAFSAPGRAPFLAVACRASTPARPRAPPLS